MSHPIFNKLDGQRKALGVTPSVLCRRAGIRKETYTRWKTSKRKPRLESVGLVCEALGLNPITLEPLPPKPDLLEELREWVHDTACVSLDMYNHSGDTEDMGKFNNFMEVVDRIDELKQGAK